VFHPLAGGYAPGTRQTREQDQSAALPARRTARGRRARKPTRPELAAKIRFGASDGCLGRDHNRCSSALWTAGAVLSAGLSSSSRWEVALPVPDAQEPARPSAGRLWGYLLALQQPHVGGLGALGPLRGVELDGLALVK
jgi:hypothetical protein